MDITYNQTNTYQILCDEKGYSSACYIITTTNIFGDKKFLSSSNAQTQVPLDKMKKIVADLKSI